MPIDLNPENLNPNELTPTQLETRARIHRETAALFDKNNMLDTARTFTLMAEQYERALFLIREQEGSVPF